MFDQPARGFDTDATLEGFIKSEVELPVEGTPFSPPAWFGAEVTGQKTYANAQMAEQLH